MEREYFEKLINQPESEYLDFKQQWYPLKDKNKKDKAFTDLKHDILCFANAYTPNDRFIIFGLSDKRDINGQREKIGIANDTNRFKDHEFQDWLSEIPLNRKIKARLTTLTSEGKEFDILQILNIPFKPFYINKKSFNEINPKPFYIYTRDQSKNTPINENAHNDDIVLMYREQFGIDKSPLERFECYLKDLNNWEKNYHLKPMEYYYKYSPEFRVVESKKELNIVQYRLTYMGYPLEEIEIFWVDAKCPLPTPNKERLDLVIKQGDIKYLKRYNEFTPLVSEMIAKANNMNICNIRDI